MNRRSRILQKISERIVVDPKTGCWIWQGPTSGNGRGGGTMKFRLSRDADARQGELL